MKLKIYQVDAFTDSIFKGNPAAVCPLESWLSDECMQAIAAENNLSETAFFVEQNNAYDIRWFTPQTEVALCGHATLASAYVLLEILGVKEEVLKFNSKSGELRVKQNKDLLTLDFPAQPAVQCEIPPEILTAFNYKPVECLKSEDYILVFESEDEIINATPQREKLIQNDLRGVIITAAAKDYDFVCRFFAPNYGIDEDPVTGSAYTQLMPYWSQELGKNILTAKQISSRGGELWLEQQKNRILISGKAVLYMAGTINI